MKIFVLLSLLTYALFAISVEEAVKTLAAESTMTSAVQKAEKEKKPLILLLVIKDGCHWCEKMVHETLKDKDVLTALDNTVTLVADINSPLAKKYKAELTPSTLFIDAKTEKVLYEDVGYEKPGTFLINIISAGDTLE